MKITDCLYQNRNRTKIAVKCGSDEITYSELWDKSCKTANTLNKLEDSIIGLVIPNSIDYIIAYFAVLISGKAVLPLSYMYSTFEIDNIMKLCDLKTIISISGNEKLRPFGKETKIIEIDLLSLDQEDSFLYETQEEEMDKTVLIIPTSGTTSNSNLVQLTDQNVCTNMQDYVNVYNLKEENHELILLPLTSLFCNTTQLLACLHVGMTISILQGQFQIDRFLDTVERDRINSCSVTPSLLKLISRVYMKEKTRLVSLKRFSYGGEMVTREELNRIRWLMPGITTVFGYGMTEAGPVITTQTPSDCLQAENSVGRALGSVEIKIINENGHELENGHEGEIIVKGPSIMKGYYGREHIGIEDGWLHTGDIGYLDTDDYLFITGRKKNIIITAGQNVCVEEVESVLNSMGNIMDSRVLSERDSNLGEIVTAQVVVMDRDGFDRNEIIEQCKSKLAGFKIPKKIYIIDNVERNANGKIIRS